MKNRPLAVLVVLFFLIPAALISVRVGFLGYPLFPTAPGDSWDLFIEARLARSPAGEGALWAGLPVPRPGLTVLEESFLSGTLPLGLTREGPNRFAVWAGPIGEEPERIAYSATVVVRPQARARTSPVRLPPYPAGFEPADQTLARRLVRRWDALPVVRRVRAVADTLLGDWGDPPPAEADLRA